MLQGVYLISMLLIGALLIAFMGTTLPIFRSAAIIERCWGRPLIKDDVAVIEKVRQHYQNDEAITRLLDENAPLKLHSSYQSGGKKFVPLNHGKGHWIMGPDSTFPIASVHGVIFESDPRKGDAFGLSCSVMPCGDVFDCKTHDLPDRQ